MKKIIALFFACGFAAAVVSCGQKSENAGTSESADTTATVTEPAPVQSEDTTSTATDTTAVQ